MYFNSLPNIRYPAPNGDQIITKDIFKRVGLKRPNVAHLALDNHYIMDGDTPDILASKLYNNTKYHWILLMVNNIVNPYEEWPRSDAELKEYVVTKYGSNAANSTHHYSIVKIEHTDALTIEVLTALDESTVLKEGLGDEPELIVDYDADRIADGSIIPVTNFEYEYELNQEKRQIKVLRAEFVKTFITQYKKLATL